MVYFKYSIKYMSQSLGKIAIFKFFEKWKWKYNLTKLCGSHVRTTLRFTAFYLYL